MDTYVLVTCVCINVSVCVLLLGFWHPDPVREILHTHINSALGVEELVRGTSNGVGVWEGVQVCEQVEPGGHVFGSTWSSVSCCTWGRLSWLALPRRRLQGRSLEHRRGRPACGAQAVVQQLGGQEARGAGGAGGRTRRRPALCCPRARWRNAGGVEQPEGVLPLSAELVGGPRARAEEVFEEGHVAPLAILLLRS